MTFIPCSLNSCRIAYDVCATKPCNKRCKEYQAQRMKFGRIAEGLKALEEYKVEIPKTSSYIGALPQAPIFKGE